MQCVSVGGQVLEEFSNPKVKRITFAFVLGNKDDKKVNN